MSQLSNEDKPNMGESTICSECGTDFEVRAAGVSLKNRTLCYKCYGEIQKHVSTESFGGAFFSFEKMISGTIIRILYILGLIGIAFLGITMIANGVDRYGGGGTIATGFAVLIFGSLSWRVICEGMIILFRLHETTVSILNELRK